MRNYRFGLFFILLLASCSPDFNPELPEKIEFDSDPRILRGSWAGDAKLNYPVSPLVYSPDGSRLFFKKALNNAIYDTQTFEVVTTLELDDITGIARFSADSATLATATTFARSFGREKNAISIWNSRTGERLDSFSVDGEVWEFSQDLARFATRSSPPELDREEIVIWDVGSQERLASIILPDVAERYYTVIEFSPDLSSVATCEDQFSEEEPVVKLWTVASGEEQFSLPLRAAVYCSELFFSSDGSLLAVEDGMGTQVWDVTTGERLSDLSGAVQPLAFSSNNQTLVSKQGSSARLWNVQAGTQLKEVLVSEAWSGYSQALEPQLSQLAWAESEGPLQVLALTSGERLAEITVSEPLGIQLSLEATYVDKTSYEVSGTLEYDGEPYTVRGSVWGTNAQEYLRPTTSPIDPSFELEALNPEGEVRWILNATVPSYAYENGSPQFDKILFGGDIFPLEKTWSREFLMERQP